MTQASLHDPVLLSHLSRQISFLRNSVRCYDDGDRIEAIRIAVAIRVLCHDTSMSHSLFAQLGVKNQLQVSSTAKKIPASSVPPGGFDVADLLAGATFGANIEFDPVPLGCPTVSVQAWWDEDVFIRDGQVYSRMDVVLAAANKDGGAHVGTPNSDLLAMKTGVWQQTRTDAQGNKTTAPEADVHFRMLRRFADELLSSPDLLALLL